MTRADLERLDWLIKDTESPIASRQLAQKMKREAPFNTSLISLNPKIDSKHQRRLQCSLTFVRVFKYLAPEADQSVQEKPMLWGVPVELEVESGPRVFEHGAAKVEAP